MSDCYYKMKLVGGDGKVVVTPDDLMLEAVRVDGGVVGGAKKLTRTGDEKVSLLSALAAAKSEGRPFGVQRCNHPKCSICREVCPVDAITFRKDGVGRITPNINYAACIRCGRCITNCPMEVFDRA